jgi:hypothetical protein
MASESKRTTPSGDGEHLSDLWPLAELKGLTSLDLRECKQDGDVGPLAHITQPIWLDLSRCAQVRDLSPWPGSAG